MCVSDGVKKRQNLLMDLFNESGVAKVESVIEHLQVFIDNPVSGKVCCVSLNDYAMTNQSKLLNVVQYLLLMLFYFILCDR